MDFELCSDDDDFQKEKKEHLDISYFEKYLMDSDNKENFDKSYDTYFKTVNKDFIYTRHHIFHAHNEDNVKKVKLKKRKKYINICIYTNTILNTS